MQTSSRDKVLILILPALLVLLVYAALFSVPHYRTMRALEKSLKTARDSVPSHAMMHGKQRQLMGLNKEVHQLKEEEKYLLTTWNAMAGSCLDPDTRSHRLTRLLEIVRNHGLKVSHYTPLDGAGDGKDQMKLSPAHERLLRRMTERDPAKKPQAWRLQVKGDDLGNMTKALQELSSGETVAIPLSVVLKVTRVTEKMTDYEWSLLLWI